MKLEFKLNQDKSGIKLKREITTQEARHIFKKILCICINEIEDCYDKDEYDDYNKNLTRDINQWVNGDIESDMIMEYAYDCADEPLPLISIINTLSYLNKKNII